MSKFCHYFGGLPDHIKPVKHWQIKVTKSIAANTVIYEQVLVYFVKSLYQSPSSLALNGGGRIFSLPVLALIFPACSPVSSSHLLRDSLCTALQTEKLWIWCKGKLIMEIRMDKESSRGIGMWLLAPRLNNCNLIFLAPLNQHWPRPRLLLENQPWEEHCSETLLRSSPILQTPADYKLLHIHTHTHIYKDMHSPPHPRSIASVALYRQPDKRVCDQR